MTSMKKRLIIGFILLLAILGAVFLNDDFIRFNNDNKALSDVGLQGKVMSSSAYFDSFVQVTVYYDEDIESLDDLEDEINEIWRTVHELATRYDTYDGVVNIKTINDSPGVFHTVDPLLFDMIELAISYHEETNGYFDITLGPVIDVWDDYREMCNEWLMSIRGIDNQQEVYQNDKDTYCRVPDDSELLAAAHRVDINGITLDHDNQAVKIRNGMQLDLGGIGKGYAAKLVGERLQADERIEAFILNAGTSNIEVYGNRPLRDSGLWYTGLSDPERISHPDPDLRRFASIYLRDGDNVTTSGDYQRYYEIDGRKYHHIIDPYTFYPTDHHRSVTLISSDGSLGDILVTAIFIMPLEEGLAYVDERDGLEAIWFIDGETMPVMSQGFEETHLRTMYRDFEPADVRFPIVIALSVLTLLAMSSGLGYHLYVKRNNTSED